MSLYIPPPIRPRSSSTSGGIGGGGGGGGGGPGSDHGSNNGSSSSSAHPLRKFSTPQDRFFPNQFTDYEGISFLFEERFGRVIVDQGFLTRINTTKNKLMKTLQDVIESDKFSEPDYSVYSGRAGFVMMYLHLALLEDDQEKRDDYLNRTRRHLTSCLQPLRGKGISFLCGDAGPLALAVTVYHYLGEEEKELRYLDKLLGLMQAAMSSDHEDELMYGRAGFLYALLFVRKHCGRDAVDDKHVERVVRALIGNGIRQSSKMRSACPLMYELHNKVYVGPAHGLTGILYLLLHSDCRAFLNEDELIEMIKPSIDFLAKLQFPSGNFPSSVNNRSDKLVQWCHGAPGMVHLFVKAAKVFPESKDAYMKLALSCNDVIWRRGLLKKGYGLCHGAAGNAYALLTLYEETGDLQLYHRALKFAEFCCDFGTHVTHKPDQPYCFMNGIAGTVCFLQDVLKKKALFPAFCLEEEEKQEG